MNAYWLLPAVILLERLLGEPPRFHPLVGFGRLAGWLESRLNNCTITHGILAWCLAVLPLSAAVWWLDT
ncbi:MAG: cobalamin biosynthesis protein, partial [Thiothrix sp.]